MDYLTKESLAPDKGFRDSYGDTDTNFIYNSTLNILELTQRNSIHTDGAFPLIEVIRSYSEYFSTANQLKHGSDTADAIIYRTILRLSREEFDGEMDWFRSLELWYKDVGRQRAGKSSSRVGERAMKVNVLQAWAEKSHFNLADTIRPRGSPPRDEMNIPSRYSSEETDKEPLQLKALEKWRTTSGLGLDRTISEEVDSDNENFTQNQISRRSHRQRQTRGKRKITTSKKRASTRTKKKKTRRSQKRKEHQFRVSRYNSPYATPTVTSTLDLYEHSLRHYSSEEDYVPEQHERPHRSRRRKRAHRKTEKSSHRWVSFAKFQRVAEWDDAIERKVWRNSDLSITYKMYRKFVLAFRFWRKKTGVSKPKKMKRTRITTDNDDDDDYSDAEKLEKQEKIAMAGLSWVSSAGNWAKATNYWAKAVLKYRFARWKKILIRYKENSKHIRQRKRRGLLRHTFEVLKTSTKVLMRERQNLTLSVSFWQDKKTYLYFALLKKAWWENQPHQKWSYYRRENINIRPMVIALFHWILITLPEVRFGGNLGKVDDQAFHARQRGVSFHVHGTTSQGNMTNHSRTKSVFLHLNRLDNWEIKKFFRRHILRRILPLHTYSNLTMYERHIDDPKNTQYHLIANRIMDQRAMKDTFRAWRGRAVRLGMVHKRNIRRRALFYFKMWQEGVARSRRLGKLFAEFMLGKRSALLWKVFSSWKSMYASSAKIKAIGAIVRRDYEEKVLSERLTQWYNALKQKQMMTFIETWRFGRVRRVSFLHWKEKVMDSLKMKRLMQHAMKHFSSSHAYHFFQKWKRYLEIVKAHHIVKRKRLFRISKQIMVSWKWAYYAIEKGRQFRRKWTLHQSMKDWITASQRRKANRIMLELASTHNTRAVLMSRLVRWRAFKNECKLMKKNILMAFGFDARNKKYHAFRAWRKEYTMLKRQKVMLLSASGFHQKRAMKEAVWQWIAWTEGRMEANAALQYALDFRKMFLKKTALHDWRLKVDERLHLKLCYGQIFAKRSLLNKSNVFREWKYYLDRQYELDEKMTERFNRRLLNRITVAWSNYATHSKSERARLRRAASYFRKSTEHKALARWKAYTKEYREMKRLAMTFLEDRQQGQKRKMFTKLKKQAAISKAEKEQERNCIEIAQSSRLLKGWRSWRKAFLILRRGQLLRESKMRALQRKILKQWKAEQQRKADAELRVQQQLRRILHRTAWKCFNSWKTMYVYHKGVKDAGIKTLDLCKLNQKRRILRGWLELYNAKAKQKDAARRFLLKVLKGQMGRSFASWVQYYENAKEMKRRLVPFINKVKNAKKIATFNTWTEFTHQQLKARKLLEKATLHLKMMRHFKAFRTWRSNVNEIVEQRALMEKAVWKFKNHEKIKYFAEWKAFWKHRQELHEIAERAARFWQSSVERKAFSGWARKVEMWRSIRERMERTVIVLQKCKALSAVKRWNSWTETRLRKKELMSNAIVHFQKKEAKAAIARWSIWTEDEIVKRERMVNAVSFFRSGHLRRSFNRWVEKTDETLRSKNAMAVAIEFFKNKEQIVAIRRWEEFAQESMDQKWKMKNALNMMLKRTLTKFMGKWINFTQQTQRNRELLNFAVQRMQQSSRRRALLTWFEWSEMQAQQNEKLHHAVNIFKNRTKFKAFQKWKEFRTCMQGMRNILRRMTNLRKGTAFDSWNQWIMIKKQAKRCTKLLAFVKWRRLAKVSAEQGRKLDVALARLRNLAAARAFTKLKANRIEAKNLKRAMQWFSNATQIRLFSKWKAFTQDEKNIRDATLAVNRFRGKKAVQIWNDWAQTRIERSEIVEHCLNRMRNRLCANYFDVWVHEVEKRKRVLVFAKKTLGSKKYRIFHQWKANAEYILNTKLAKYEVEKLVKSNRIQNAWEGWLLRTRFMNEIHRFEKIRQASFKRRYFFVLRNIILEKREIAEGAIELQKKIDSNRLSGSRSGNPQWLREVMCAIRNPTLKRSWSSWKHLVNEAAELKAQMQVAMDFWTKGSLRGIFEQWRRNAETIRQRRRSMSHWKNHQLSSSFRRWLDFVDEREKTRKQMRIAATFFNKHSVSGTFYRWKIFHNQVQDVMYKKDAVRKLHSDNVRRHYLQAWKTKLGMRKVEQMKILRAMGFSTRNSLAVHFKAWANVLVVKAYREEMIQRSIARYESLLKTNFFNQWKWLTVEIKTLRFRVTSLARRSLLTRLKVMIHTWREETSKRRQLKKAVFFFLERRQQYVGFHHWRINAEKIAERARLVATVALKNQFAKSNKLRYLFQLWNAGIAQQRKERKAFAGYMMGRAVPRLWKKWKFWWDRSKHYKNLCKKITLRMKFRLQSKAFIGWKEKHLLMIEQRRKVTFCLNRIRQRSLVKVFFTWRTKANDSARQKDLVKLSLARMRKGCLTRCFAKWADIAMEGARVKQAYREVKSLRENNVRRKLLSNWVTRMFEKLREQELKERAARYLINHNLSKVWNAWTANVEERKHNRNLLRRGVATFAQRSKLHAVRRWFEMVELRAERREMMDAALQFLVQAKLRKAWNGFVQQTQFWKEKRRLAEKTCKMFQMRLVYRTYLTWKENVDSISRQKDLIFKCVKGMSDFKKRNAIRSLWNNVVERNKYRDNMVKALEHKYFRSAESCFIEWRDRVQWEIQVRTKLAKFARVLRNRFFYSWRKAAIESKEERERLQRAVGYWTRHCVGKAFNSWNERTYEIISLRKAVNFFKQREMIWALNSWKAFRLTSKGNRMLRRWQNKLTYTAFNGWKEKVLDAKTRKRKHRALILKIKNKHKRYFFSMWRNVILFKKACSALVRCQKSDVKTRRFKQWKSTARYNISLRRAIELVSERRKQRVRKQTLAIWTRCYDLQSRAKEFACKRYVQRWFAFSMESRKYNSILLLCKDRNATAHMKLVFKGLRENVKLQIAAREHQRMLEKTRLVIEKEQYLSRKLSKRRVKSAIEFWHIVVRRKLGITNGCKLFYRLYTFKKLFAQWHEQTQIIREKKRNMLRKMSSCISYNMKGAFTRWGLFVQDERLEEERTVKAYKYLATKQLRWIIEHWKTFHKVSKFYHRVERREKMILFTRWCHFTARSLKIKDRKTLKYFQLWKRSHEQEAILRMACRAMQGQRQYVIFKLWKANHFAMKREAKIHEKLTRVFFSFSMR
eukprot:g1960.t1